jgi:hypothetical protein
MKKGKLYHSKKFIPWGHQVFFTCFEFTLYVYWVIVCSLFLLWCQSELLTNVDRITGVAARLKLKCNSLLSCLYLEHLMCVCNSNSFDWTIQFESEGNFTMLLDVVNILVVMEVCALCLTLWNYGTCCISSHLNYYKLIQGCQNILIILSRFLKWRPGTVASFKCFSYTLNKFSLFFYCTQYCLVSKQQEGFFFS